MTLSHRKLLVLPLIGVLGFGTSAGLFTSGCGSTPSAFFVDGPQVTGNTVPSLVILEPIVNTTKGRGDNLLIRWSDSDQDSNAVISFLLVNTVTNASITLVSEVKENDTGTDSGPDSITAGTSLVPVGDYNLLGIIEDGVNPASRVFAETTVGTIQQRVVVKIVDPGTQPPTNPPTIAVTEPIINRSVAQDDILNITVQPTLLAPNENLPYDEDSNITIYFLLDLDLNPNNDDPANPVATEIIMLRQATVNAGGFDPVSQDIPIDLAQIPSRPDGQPYYIRVTIDDLTNPRVHAYAPGTINVVQLASGLVDLDQVGMTLSGAKFYGFSPGANLGSNASGVGDFDADGVDDFVLVAQYGSPRNFVAAGEAYVIYGQNGRRFGNAIPANSVSDNLSGVIIEGPPRRDAPDGVPLAEPGDSLGITDVSFIRDLTGDGRPELLFSAALVQGAVSTMDFDPGDSDLEGEENTLEIELVFQQGEVTLQEGNATPGVINPLYNGVIDTFINSQFPNASFGNEERLEWRNEGQGQRQWVLIKFQDVLDEIPDTAFNIQIDTVEASLELRVFNTGSDAQLHQCLTDFTEQTTFADFAEDGGEPLPDVDYELEGDGGLDAVGGDAAETINVDVTLLVQRLLDRELAEFDNELRFIFVPEVDADNLGAAAARSSEFSFDRPLLRIGYTRENLFGNNGCYPDQLVNNFTDEADEPSGDVGYFSGGCATILNSSNRDAAGIINPDRLEATSVAFELIGGESGFVFDDQGANFVGGDIFARADTSGATDIGTLEVETEGAIAGARFVGGHYDYRDHAFLRQGPRRDLFGMSVASIGDLNNDTVDEIIISAPRNERYLADLLDENGLQSTHWQSTTVFGSIVILPGQNYNTLDGRDKGEIDNSTATIPLLDQHIHAPTFGKCTDPREPRHLDSPIDQFEIFAEELDDFLGDGQSAGDFNLDGIDDILCGAPLNNISNSIQDTGASYILYGRTILGDFILANADDRLRRSPMLRIRGNKTGDQVGWKQATGLDVNGDRIDDVFISSPRTDFGNVVRASCGADSQNATVTQFNSCFNTFSVIAPDEQLFSDNTSCKRFDYDNDGDVDFDDRCVFCCLSDSCEPDATCIYGKQAGSCCANIVDNGFVGVIFGGVFTDGDRSVSQIATEDLAGAIFYGSGAGYRAGHDVSSAGDFNEDGFGDILIAVPGEERIDSAGRKRLGVVYMVFGGTHLNNTVWDLALVGSDDLPGIVFVSPYVAGAPNEAAPKSVGFLGDINRDGFGDITIGIPDADFIDLSFPQGPNAPDSDAAVGRRSNAGNAYVIYGNNFGSNRGGP